MVETRKILLLREFFLIILTKGSSYTTTLIHIYMLCFLKISNIPTKQKANKFSGYLADMNLLAFLVPWRQTKTHGQYFIGNLELKNHQNPHN